MYIMQETEETVEYCGILIQQQKRRVCMCLCVHDYLHCNYISIAFIKGAPSDLSLFNSLIGGL